MINQLEIQNFEKEININVIKGLRSIKRRVYFQAKIHISIDMYSYLKSKYQLLFKLKNVEQFLDDFRILRAYFKNESDVSKIADESFKISVRKSRKIEYKRFKNGILISNFLQPDPYFIFSFIRNDKVL